MNSWFKSNILDNNDYIQPKYSIDITDDKVLRCKKIYLYPTDEQKIKLETWFNSYCFIYNSTIKYIRKNKLTKINFRKIRPIVWNLLTNEQKNFMKSIGIPRHTLDYAMKDVVSAYKTAFTNRKKFRIRYKKQSSPRQTLVLESYAFSTKNNTFCSNTFDNIKSSESIIGLNHNCRLTHDRSKNMYILNVPYDKYLFDIKGRDKAIALDPGIRDFQTGYSESGIYHFGRNPRGKIEKQLKEIDKIRSKKTNRRMKIAEFKRINKIKDLVNDLHYKTADYLCLKYDVIMIGKISIQSIMSNNKQLAAITKRIGYALSHYTFRQRLKDRCEEYGVKYIEVDERYTSKTCSRCENVKPDLGANKIYLCKECNLNINRDVNAAINIYKRGRLASP